VPVPQRVAAERSRELRTRVQEKAERYRRARAGGAAEVALEGDDPLAGLTEDYLRVRVLGGEGLDRGRLHAGVLEARGGHLYIDLSRDPGERETGGARNAGAAGGVTPPSLQSGSGWR
jgi:hypothetical protein